MGRNSTLPKLASQLIRCGEPLRSVIHRGLSWHAFSHGIAQKSPCSRGLTAAFHHTVLRFGRFLAVTVHPSVTLTILTAPARQSNV